MEINNNLEGKLTFFERGIVIGAITIGAILSVIISVESILWLSRKNTYNPLNADVKAYQSSEGMMERNSVSSSGSAVYGYDTNKDGKLDLIKEYWMWYGCRAATLCEKDYLPRDKEFQGLEQLLIKNKMN